jgi:hypothetical protein
MASPRSKPRNHHAPPVGREKTSSGAGRRLSPQVSSLKSQVTRYPHVVRDEELVYIDIKEDEMA